MDVKYRYANHYLDQEDYLKALPLFEELIPAYRLQPRGEESYYKYAMCYYGIRDYYMAGYYFKSFVRNNPSSALSEDALFYSALSHVKTSPESELDQTETRKAIDELQLFIDLYPESSKVDSSNHIMDKLRNKLEVKSFEIAKQYFKTENYKAAAVAFEALISDYPASKFKEEILYLRMKSNFQLAVNSVPSKKRERFENTLKSYHIFVAAFPESHYKREADNIFGSSERQLEKLNRSDVSN